MSDFFKKFLLEDPRRLSPTGRYVGLAAFGKHPGWDDHVEDLGLETQSLNLAKTIFYVNGIGGQIDSGAWEKLDSSQQVAAFNHVFVWQRSGQILLGRLWSSSDGKGRTRYPMVVCLQFAGVTLGWALKQGLPALAALAEGCAKATTAEEVRSLLSQKRAALREAIQAADGKGEYAPVTPELLHKTLQSPADGNSEAFLRVLYQMKSQLGAFAPGKFNARANPAATRAQQVRVPAAGLSPDQALLFWTRFFLTHVDASVPLLLTLPLEAEWLDATVGEPESHEFFSLRASPKAVPLVSEVPYNLDTTFRTKAGAFLDGFQRGETVSADIPTEPLPALDAPPPAKGGWLKWLGVGLILLLGALAAMFLWPKDGKDQARIPSSSPQVTSTSPPQSQSPVPVSSPGNAVKAPVVPATALANPAPSIEDKKNMEAMAAAAKLKTEAETAAKEKERQTAEAARLASEREAAAKRELLEQQRQAAIIAAAKKKSDDEARAKADLAALTRPVAVVADSAPPKTAVATASAPAVVRNEITNSIGMVLVPLPAPRWAGTRMWVGKYEVTQAEYQQVMGTNPSSSVNARQPVERVSWNDATEFCRKLNAMEQGKLIASRVYSLPTAKQWDEFLGGQRFEDLNGSASGSKDRPAIVGQAGPANKFGLFDVVGNVWEWCADGPGENTRYLRGGAFNNSSFNRSLSPDVREASCGFRCVLAAQ
jgi:formylglycine-generating enzyme required for sulfatase activity